MPITLSLTNDLTTLQFPTLEVPLINGRIENAVDVETLDGNIYTDFIRQKRRWTIKYSILTEAQYDSIVEFYDRQFDAYLYPLLSIPHYSVSDVPVRMYINDQEVWKNCGDVQNIIIQFRESNQLDGVTS